MIAAARSPAPLDVALAGFIGAACALIVGVVAGRTVLRRVRAPETLSLARFLLSLALLVIMAAVSWERPPGLAGAFILGVLSGVMLATTLPRQR